LFTRVRLCTPLLLPKVLPAWVAFGRQQRATARGPSDGTSSTIGEGSVYFDAQKDRWVGAMIADGRRYKVVAKTKTDARKRIEAGPHPHR